MIRALNVQKKASWIAIGAYYGISLPVACTLVFSKIGMDVKGLWLAMALGTTAQAVFYVRLVLVTDWYAVAEQA